MGTWYLANEIFIQQACVFAILAASVQMLLRAGVFSFAPVGTWMIGAYCAAIFFKGGVAAPLSILLAMLAGGVLAFVVAAITRALSGLVLGMATLAVVLIIVVAAESGGSLTGGAAGLYGITPQLSTGILFVFVVIVAALLFFLERGKFGRAINAMREDAHVARTVGIPVVQMQLGLSTLAGILGALSGASYTFLFNSVTPDAGGFNLVVSTLSMVIIGGVASWGGAYLGAALLTLLPSFLSGFEAWSQAAYGVVLIVVVVFAPGGLLGLGRDALKRIRLRRRSVEVAR